MRKNESSLSLFSSAVSESFAYMNSTPCGYFVSFHSQRHLTRFSIPGASNFVLLASGPHIIKPHFRVVLLYVDPTGIEPATF